jgi:hypothetical protein
MVTGSGEVVPAVMLSPNARKRTEDSTGTAETMTEKPHVPVLPRLSVAVQVTRVDPIGNAVLEAGVHVVDTGAEPPDATGVSKTTTGNCPCRADAWMSAGHVSVGGGTGGSGLVGDPPHAGSIARSAIRGTWRLEATGMNLSNTYRSATVASWRASSQGQE